MTQTVLIMDENDQKIYINKYKFGHFDLVM